MAKKFYDEKINKDTDWGGDNSTNNLPVAGRRVQEFIKDQLQNKVGLFYYDVTNNRYLVFADTQSKDLYLEDPINNTQLILGTFDAPFNYTAEIHLMSQSYNAVAAGSTGNYIEFDFDIKNKSGQSTGEDVSVMFTIRRGSVTQTKTERYRSGSIVRFNVDEYLSEGTNNITIVVTGQQTLAAISAGVTYQVVDLSLSDSFVLGQVYDLREDNNSSVEIPYSISGYGAKTMEWYLDGELLPSISIEDEITTTSSSRVKVIDISNLTHGAHSIQFRAFTIINGEKFYSQTYYREIAVRNNSNTTIVTRAATLPRTAPIIGPDEQLTLYGIEQYSTASIRFAVNSFKGEASIPTTIKFDNSVVATVDAKNGEETSYSFMAMTPGLHNLTIEADGVEAISSTEVSYTTTTLEEITNERILQLRSLGRTNEAADRDDWSYDSYHTTFSGFNWNKSSGWNNDRLLIPSGASITTDCKPLSVNPTSKGLTIEFDLMTYRVKDDDAIICDMTNSDGSGILLTSTGIKVRSVGGMEIKQTFKADKEVHIAIVINRATGTTHRGLAFIYLDGIPSAVSNFATNDSFMCQKPISFVGSDKVCISLKDIRVYQSALTPDQVLNNFILYRDTAEEMMKIYRRNDIYLDGTDTIDPEKVASQLPVKMIIGDIPALEATTDKKYAIVVDAEYTNMEDTSLEYKVTSQQMTPQGTSSMSYPKKNFREYFNKRPDTVVINNNGDIIVERLYAFTHNSIPVDCWCDKADYAESSGTHNTGVARLWNKVMYNAQIDGEFLLRTKAQQAAIDNDYPYDVRTTIDGFPIAMFYKLSETSDPVFIGKYNFNNDKSTENVFGFRDIPGFDNSNVECWEVLNNGNHLALFQDTNNWDSEWEDAFEGRYPDGNKDTTALRNFANWIVDTDQERFATEKWDRLDVYKTAAYYIYLMRFGAVDQPVKNSMLTTEDGIHWFWINYDNDTIFGLRNDGPLVYDPYITRQTLDPSFSSTVYAYAGHDSKLWNLLEGDEEFMKVIVPKVDDALYAAGLSYGGIVDMFDNQQAGKWCERIYIRDAEYKYLGPWLNEGINNLYMLQGSRTHHRNWWVSRRFNWLDGMWASGAYRANVIELKMAGAPIGLDFSVTSGSNGFFGYGVNNVRIATGIELNNGESTTFTTQQVLNVGDPLRIYNATSVGELDIHNFTPYLSGFTIAGAYTDALGTNLRALTLGGESLVNTSLSEISGLNSAEMLEELNIRGYKGLSSLDLSNQHFFTTLLADNSGLTSVKFASGAPVSKLELPDTMQAVDLEDLPNLTFDGLTLPLTNLRSLTIKNCQNLSDSYSILKTILSQAGDECTINFTGINYNKVDTDEFIELCRSFKPTWNINLTGTINLISCNFEQGDALMEIFGKYCFDAGAALRFVAPPTLDMQAPESILSGESAVIRCSTFPITGGTTRFSLGVAADGVSIDQDGVLSTNIATTDRSVVINGDFTAEDGTVFPRQQRRILIKGREDITSVSLSQTALIGRATYNLIVSPSSSNMPYTVEWSINNSDVNIVEQTDSSVTLETELTTGTVTITAKVIRATGITSTATCTATILSADALSNPLIIDAEGVCNIKIRNSLYNSAYSYKGIGYAENQVEEFKNTSDNTYQYYTTPDLPKGSKIYLYGYNKAYEIDFDYSTGSPGISGIIDLRGGSNIVSVKALTTKIQGVRFLDSVNIQTLHLPSTITEFMLISSYMEVAHNVLIAGTDNLRQIVFKSTINSAKLLMYEIVKEILMKVDDLASVRLHLEYLDNITDIEDGFEICKKMIQCSGVGLDLVPEQLPTVVGTMTIGGVDKEELTSVQEALPNLTIIPSWITSQPDGNIQICNSTFDISNNSSDKMRAQYYLEMKRNSTVTIDWGDGSEPEVIEALYSTNQYPTHTYKANTMCICKISDVENLNKITIGYRNDYCARSINSVGNFTGVISLGSESYKCYNIKSITPDLFVNISSSRLTSYYTQYMFRGLLIDLPDDIFDPIESINSINHMFYEAKITKIPSSFVRLLQRSPDLTEAYCTFRDTNIKEIPDDLFSASTKLYNAGGCFYNCSSLTTMPNNLFDNVESSELNLNTCFSGCKALQCLYFPNPKSADLQASSIFEGIYNKPVVVYQTTPPLITSSSLSSGTIIYVPDESVEDYQQATNWSSHTIKPMSEFTE